jgi:sulfite exporter TauE/SafE
MTLTPNTERRARPRSRGSASTTITRAHRLVAHLSRLAQVVAGFLVGIPGTAALYVVGRRAVANHAVTLMDWAFFVLGAVLLLIGFGLALNGYFWRAAGRLADVADGVWSRVRRGRAA